MIRVLFVCLGNICRSPMAEAIFSHLVKEAGLQDEFEVDSCGTGPWNLGMPPHAGTCRVLKQRGVSCNHRSRQICLDDLDRFDYVIAMDRRNLQDILDMGSPRGAVRLLLSACPELNTDEVPDPYGTGRFEEVYHLVNRGCQSLIKMICREAGLALVSQRPQAT